MFKRVLEFYGTIGVPLVYLLGLYLVTYGAKMTVPIELQIGGLIGGIGGIVIWIVTYFQLGMNFGVLPREQKRVTTGLYRYIKHPMYKGIMLTYLGLSLANSSLTGAEFTVFIMLPLLFIRARLEDQKLKD